MLVERGSQNNGYSFLINTFKFYFINITDLIKKHKYKFIWRQTIKLKWDWPTKNVETSTITVFFCVF